MNDFLFHCSCGRRECDALKKPEVEILYLLREIQDDVRTPLRISGMRCRFWNQKQGGSPISGHLTGTEVDIQVSSMRDRHVILASAYRHGSPRICIGETYIHIGTKSLLDQQVTWLFRQGHGVPGNLGC